MTDTGSPVLLAEARSRSARERLLGTLGEVKEKLNPATLAQDAVGNVTDNVVRNTVDTVRARPGTAAAVVSVAALFLARKPLARLLWRGAKHATAAVPASFKSRRAKRETKGSIT